MLCCGGEKDNGRDLKSAQNTPSRQPMHQPYPQPQQLSLQQQQQQLGPPPLMQPVNRFPPPMTHLNNFPKDDFRKVRSNFNHSKAKKKHDRDQKWILKLSKLNY